MRLENHVLLPGFVNAHTHTGMYLFKSYGDDNSLSDWLGTCFMALQPRTLHLAHGEEVHFRSIHSGRVCCFDLSLVGCKHVLCRNDSQRNHMPQRHVLPSC